MTNTVDNLCREIIMNRRLFRVCRVCLMALVAAAAAIAGAQAPLASPAASNPLYTPPAPRLDARLTAPAKPGGVIELDRIVAVVNNEVITMNDLNERTATVVAQLTKQGTPLPPADVLKKQLLDRMVLDLVEIQEAKETGIKVDDATLDKTLQRIADENSLSMTEFRRLTEQDGIRWGRFREEIRGEVMKTRLREREVGGNINVT